MPSPYDRQEMVRRIRECAEDGLCNIEIARYLNVSPSTVHSAAREFNIDVVKRNGGHGRKSRQIVEPDRAGDVGLDGTQQVARPAIRPADGGGVIVVARGAEASFKGSRALTPHQRLVQKLKGVTCLKEAREIKYGHDLFEFEKRMYMEQPEKRGPLPAMVRRSFKDTHKKAAREAEERAERVVSQIERLMDMVDDDLIFTSTEAAELLDDSIPRVASYLKRMWEKGMVYRHREFIRVDGMAKKQWRWLFCKTPFTFDKYFEDDE